MENYMSDLPKLMTCSNDLKTFLHRFARYEMRWSYKLDGVRCLVKIDKEGISYYSRSHKPFPNFSVFDSSFRMLAKSLQRNFKLADSEVIYIDGEVTSADESFKSVMTQLRRIKDADPSMFVFNMFDIPTLHNTAFIERFEILQRAELHLPPDLPLRLVGHWSVNDDPVQIFEEAVKTGREGIVLKISHSPYEGKRSIYWCKMKAEKTMDLPVIGAIPGNGKYSGMVGALVCDLGDWKTVRVSGFTDDQRAEFTKELPKMIEVEYQSITPNGRLRHPRFVRVREDKS